MIPRGFNYSQSSLTAFDRCRRQFLLRYVERLAWPAPLTDQLDKWEAAANRGRAFHQLALQESLGLDVEDAVQRSRDRLLAAWWRNWREQPPMVPAGVVFGETMLSVPLAGRRLVAKFDRVVLAEEGRAWIFDWKTGRKKPDQAAYEQSWQTLVYRFVLVEAGAVLNEGRALAPDAVDIGLLARAVSPGSTADCLFSRRARTGAGAFVRGDCRHRGAARRGGVCQNRRPRPVPTLPISLLLQPTSGAERRLGHRRRRAGVGADSPNRALTLISP